MSRKDELIARVKNLAVTPEDYSDSVELLKMMDYYHVHGLCELTEKQVEEYLWMTSRGY